MYSYGNILVEKSINSGKLIFESKRYAVESVLVVFVLNTPALVFLYLNLLEGWDMPLFVVLLFFVAFAVLLSKLKINESNLVEIEVDQVNLNLERKLLNFIEAHKLWKVSEINKNYVIAETGYSPIDWRQQVVILFGESSVFVCVLGDNPRLKQAPLFSKKNIIEAVKTAIGIRGDHLLKSRW